MPDFLHDENFQPQVENSDPVAADRKRLRAASIQRVASAGDGDHSDHADEMPAGARARRDHRSKTVRDGAAVDRQVLAHSARKNFDSDASKFVSMGRGADALSRSATSAFFMYFCRQKFTRLDVAVELL